jgi:hypothetical protein
MQLTHSWSQFFFLLLLNKSFTLPSLGNGIQQYFFTYLFCKPVGVEWAWQQNMISYGVCHLRSKVLYEFLGYLTHAYMLL